MEKRFFLSWIARQRSNVVGRHTQAPTLVETNFTDAAFAFLDQATMTACVTFECARLEMFG
jgi:hypothetical protein